MRAFLGVMRRFWIVTLGRGRRALKLLGARRADARASAGIEAFTSGRGEKARIMEGRLSTEAVWKRGFEIVEFSLGALNQRR